MYGVLLYTAVLCRRGRPNTTFGWASVLRKKRLYEADDAIAPEASQEGLRGSPDLTATPLPAGIQVPRRDAVSAPLPPLDWQLIYITLERRMILDFLRADEDAALILILSEL